MKYSILVVALASGASVASARSWSSVPRASFTLKNGEDAIALNNHFKTLTASSSCSNTKDAQACVGGKFAQCVNGKFVTTPCNTGLTCVALPLVNSPGTSITCSTPADRDARIARTGAKRALVSRADFTLKNGQDAIAANARFATLTDGGACDAAKDANACVGDKFAQCVNGKFVAQACAPGTVCAALPLVNSAGTSVSCTTAADRDARIAATGATAGGAAAAPPAASAVDNAAAASTTTSAAAAATSSAAAAAADSGDLQKSLTLDKSVIATGFANNGQDVPAEGQVASLTSTNNFINFCATVPNLPITNGQQIKTGSCNPAPMGVIPATSKMPSAKFANPKNGDTLKANTAFTVTLAINNLATGNFVNANANYFSAPQQVNADGVVLGHSHVVIETLDSLAQTTPLDPNKFAFFKGLNAAAVDGKLSADVTAGLPAGFYKLSTINTAANHQPVLGPVAQHGSFDDVIYFTVQ